MLGSMQRRRPSGGANERGCRSATGPSADSRKDLGELSARRSKRRSLATTRARASGPFFVFPWRGLETFTTDKDRPSYSCSLACRGAPFLTCIRGMGL